MWGLFKIIIYKEIYFNKKRVDRREGINIFKLLNSFLICKIIKKITRLIV